MSEAEDSPEWETLLASVGEWTLEELPQKALEFVKHLDNNEAICNPNIISGNFLPALFVQLIQLLAARSKNIDPNLTNYEGLLFGGLASMLLPNSVLEGNEEVILAHLASNLLPKNFPGGPIHIRPLCGILDPGNDFQWSPVLNDESAQFLQSRAAALLDSAPEGIDSKTELRWHEIANRHFPLGFNTSTEERWVLVDMRRLLVPNQVLFDTSQEMITYLKRSAQEKLEVLTQSDALDEEMKAHLVALRQMSDLDVAHCIPKHISS